MCGIYLSNNIKSLTDAKSELKKISYRGPDNITVKKEEDVYIGHLRLSIIDVDERSNQPYYFKNLVISFNGEIYNYRDLKDELSKYHDFVTESDTEVLIVGYYFWKEKILDNINGMFSFVIYNLDTKEIFAARDRIGVKPLYYFYENDIIEICSQLQSFSINKKISNESLSIYYDLGYIPSPLSVFEKIHKLKPGNYLIIDRIKNQIKTKEYWDIKKPKYFKNKFDYDKIIESSIKNSVDLRLKSDVPLGSFLSGGIDSSIISLFASKNIPDINTYTIGFKDEKYDESTPAADISNQIGILNKNKTCDENELFKQVDIFFKIFDEPFSDSSAIPSLLVNKLVKEDVTVALSGDGGDESFFGYNHFKWIKYVNIVFTILPYKIRKLLSYSLLKFNYIIKNKRIFFISNILRNKSINEFIVSIFLGFDKLSIKQDQKWFDNNYKKYLNLSDDIYQKAADLNIKLWLENDSNVKTDRASMGNSVELRSPFLDYTLVEQMRNIPYKFRKEKSPLKIILKKNNIKSESFSKKKGFSIPLKKWINGPLKNDIIEQLNDDFIDKLPNFDKLKFNKMLTQHFQNKNDYSYFIWRIYVLSKWMEINKVRL